MKIHGYADEGKEIERIVPNELSEITLVAGPEELRRINKPALGLHHRINFGEPWLDSSKCTRGFISLPYLDGPKFETLCLEETHVSFLWLIPITESEAGIVDVEGVEGLESRFEKLKVQYIDPNRESVA